MEGEDNDALHFKRPFDIGEHVGMEGEDNRTKKGMWPCLIGEHVGMEGEDNVTDAQRLAAIRRIAMAHNSPASNVGANALAVLVLEIIEGKERRLTPNRQIPGVTDTCNGCFRPFSGVSPKVRK